MNIIKSKFYSVSGFNALSFGIASGLLLSSCSGDGRAFTEAVEANNLQLKTLTVVQPAKLLPDLVVNPGDQFSFTLDATNVSDTKVTLPSGNRRWNVDNSAVASIDDGGNLSALSKGVAYVSVAVGAVGSQRFKVEVREEVLQTIDSIVAKDIEVDGVLERCLPQQYRAIGRFVAVDGSGTSSLRALPAAQWSVGNKEVGSVAKPVDGFASVTGVNVEPLVVIATVDEIAPLSRSIAVSDTLREIEIEPRNAAVTLGNTLPLLALATYEVDGVERNGIDITESVNWFAEEENSLLTVGNTVFNKGIVTPIATGNESVTASCGNLASQKTVIVGASDTTSESSISIRSVILSLTINRLGVQLQLSSGTSFDEDNEIESDTTWSFIGDTNNVATITTSGFITPLAPGTVTVQAVNDGRATDIDILVTQ